MKYLFNPKCHYKNLRVKNFVPITEFASDVLVSDEIKSEYKLENLYGTFNSNIERLYYINGRLIVHGTDGRLCEYYNNSYRFIMDNLTISPEICAVIHGGMEKLLILCYDKAFLYGDYAESVTGLTFGYNPIFYKGRLLCSMGNTLIISGAFDFESSSFDTTNKTTINPPLDMGDILRIYNGDDGIIIVYSRGVYSLKYNQSQVDFTLTKLWTTDGEIVDKSVGQADDSLYFIVNNNLHQLKGGKVNKIKSITENHQFNIVEKAFDFDMNYALPVNYNGRNYVYIRNARTDSEQFVSVPSKDCVSGGYLIDSTLTNMKKFSLRGESYVEPCWISVSLDFDSPYKKRLAEISFYSSSKGSFTIDSDGLRSVYSVKPGINIKKMHLVSRQFKFMIKGAKSGLTIKNMYIKYSEMGE